MTRYIVIHLLWGEANFEATEAFFGEYAKREDFEIIFLQNREGDGFPVVEPAVKMAGDNRLREFSAWEKGVAYYETNMSPRDDDVLVLTNDTIFRARRLVAFAQNHGMRSLESHDFSRRIVVGPVGTDLAGSRIFGRMLTDLIATYFVAIGYRHYKRVGGILGEIDYPAYLADRYQRELFINPATRDFNEFYHRWLGPGMPEGVGLWQWSAKTPYTPENFEFLREKAKMYLLEANFTCRLRSQRFKIIDLYRANRLKRAIKKCINIAKRLVGAY